MTDWVKVKSQEWEGKKINKKCDNVSKMGGLETADGTFRGKVNNGSICC